jgi:hypothetical protein
LVTNEPITKLKLASNCAYFLHVDGNFFADGGLRCSPKEAIIDEFEIKNGSTNICLYLHYIGYNNSNWHRMIFSDPFFCDFDGSHTWKCSRNSGLTYGTKISSQLPRQNIVGNEQWDPVELKQFQNFDWKFIDRQIKFIYHELLFTSEKNTAMIVPKKFPQFNQKTNTSNPMQDTYSLQNIKLSSNDNLMEILHANKDPNSVCYTFDLQKIGLHKLFVNTTEPIFVYYSEISNFANAWNTPNRNKVWMADAFLSGQNKTSSEWRGCRYIHVLTTKTCKFEIKDIRKEYNFNWIPIKFPKEKYQHQQIYEECKNNLIACVDGGIVDTCWRERTQWVGDAYMSIKALSLMCTNSQPIVDNVLRQISQSYDKSKGMVQGAFPIKKLENLSFYMPTYHLLWCLTVLEHQKTEYYPIVSHSLSLWENTYLNKKTNLIHPPGWNFVDWYDDCTFGDEKRSGENSFVNILYLYLCSQFNIQTKVTKEIIDAMYFSNGWYTLYPNSPQVYKHPL